MEPASSTDISIDNMTGNTTPEQFLQHLRSLIAQEFSGDPSIRIRAADGNWDTVILGLSDHFFAFFPLPGSIPWGALQEKITLLDAASEIIYRASQRVDGLFTGQRDAVQVLFVRLLNLCNVLDVWLEAGIDLEHGIPSPNTLRGSTFRALVEVLRCLGGTIVAAGQSDEPRWKRLRDILNECIDIIDGTINCIGVICAVLKLSRRGRQLTIGCPAYFCLAFRET